MNNNLSIRTALRALLLSVAVAALYYMPYDQLTNLTLLALAGFLAVPIAAYRLEYRLFARRAVIAQGCTHHGFARRRLWNGALLKIVNYLASIVIAILVIVVSSSLDNSEWLIVMIATAFLLLLESATLQFTAKQTTGEFHAIFQRGLIKWPVILFIIIAASLIFIDAQYPVYIDQDVMFLVAQSFQSQTQIFSSPLLGYTHAALASIDTVTMYLAQNYIPRIEDETAKWVMWSYLAIKSAVSTGLVIYLLLGFLTLASVKERKGWKILGQTVFEKYFTLTLLLMIGVYLYASNITVQAKKYTELNSATDCSATLEAVRVAHNNRKRQLLDEEQKLSEEVENEIDATVDSIFASAKPGIEMYLNWHFSVLGEYQQLGAQLLPTIGRGSSAILEQHVMGGINTQLNRFSAEIDSKILDRINNSSKAAGTQFPSDLPYGDCLPSLNYEPLVFDKNPVYVGHPQTLVAGSAVVALIAKKTAAKVGAKGLGKAAGKYAASLASGLTLAGFCGPFAPLCGVGAAVVTWIAIDAVVVTADEIMNRNELRQDILYDLEKQKATVKQQMIALNIGAISTSYDIIESTFNIPRDGV